MGLSSIGVIRISFLLRAEFVIKKRDSFDSAKIIFKRDVFVGRVCVFVRQSKAQEYARDLESIVHLSDKRNGATFTNKHGFLAEAGLQRVDGFLENWVRIRRDPWFSSAKDLEFAGNFLGQQFANMFFD